ncbi:DNA (cytosine-5-)-methyltransferase [Microbacterium sp. NPDC090225]|uniref:DNA (cytosine-5-)-methyltransferase n=1 Tax=Microbacterium sp. NPDC090225 TaxID=3364207 RepID=UPI0038220F58
MNETLAVPDSLMDVERAAVALRVTPQRVRSLARAGVLAGRQVGRTWLLEAGSVKQHAAETGVLVQPSTSALDDGGLKVMSFFSGAMGLDLGMERAGLETVFASDVDAWCRASIHANRPQMPVIGDVWKYSPAEMLELAGLREGEVDVIAGGPPCQAFSTAGRRKGVADVRGNVFLRYLDILREIKPRYFVIENVRGLLSMAVSPGSKHNDEEIPAEYHSHAGVIRYVCAVMERAGYKVSFNLYNAANYGAPQKRERVVILGTREGSRIAHLRPTHAESGQLGLPQWRTFRDAVDGLGAHDHLDFPASRLKYYRMLKDGQYWKDLPKNVQREAMGRAFDSGGGRTGFFRRVAWDLPSPTLVTSPTMPATDLAHPEELRPLSVQEYGRLQEFPDGWELAGPIKEKYRQLGNAVPLSLGEAIGRTLIAHSVGESLEEIADFPYSRYRNTSDHDLLDRPR